MNPNDKENAANSEQPEILVNDQGQDSTVVVAERDRTVVLTENETIVIEKEPHIEIVPANRPRKVYGGMWGTPELAVFGFALLSILGILAIYLFWVAPSNRELEQNRVERTRLEQELISAKAKYGDITSTETQVAKLVASVDDFESRFLPVAATGRTSLYQRINGLIAGYGLVNTNGPNFAPLELNEQSQNGTEQNEQERGRAKFRSIFPGVYVTMTVEGSYQNLRRFIREIETGNEFVVISSIELEPTETKAKQDDPTNPQLQPVLNQPFASNTRGINTRTQQFPAPVQQQQAQRPQGKTHGETVSLRLEMAAYFRRLNFAPAVE